MGNQIIKVIESEERFWNEICNGVGRLSTNRLVAIWELKSRINNRWNDDNPVVLMDVIYCFLKELVDGMESCQSEEMSELLCIMYSEIRYIRDRAVFIRRTNAKSPSIEEEAYMQE